MKSRKIRVFLADDHAMVREALAMLLGRDGDIEIVGQCGDGLKVVERVSRVRPDVVVLDICMPGMNGLDICRALASKANRAAVLVLTMVEDPHIVAKAIQYGASGFVLKEAAGDELCRGVRAVAQGELYMGSGIPAIALRDIQEGGADAYDLLTERERQVLQMIAEGETGPRIAEALSLAVKTVETHRANLMKKLGIHNQVRLARYAMARGLVPPGPTGPRDAAL